jgi:hypothetical protein
MCASLGTQEMPLPAVKTTISQAVEFVQKMAEEQYGVTNLRDHLKPGDTAFMPPSPIQSAEGEAITRAMVEAGAPPEMGDHLQAQSRNFWGAGVGLPAPMNHNPIAAAIPTTIDAARAMAAPAVMEARALHSDPVGLLHEAGKRGLDPTSRKNLLIHSKGTPVIGT